MNRNGIIFDETVHTGGPVSVRVSRFNNVQYMACELYSSSEDDAFYLDIRNVQVLRAPLTAKQVVELIVVLKRALKAKRQDPQIIQDEPKNLQL